MNNVLIIIGMLISAHLLGSEVFLGVDVFFQKQHDEQLKGKNVGLITNHTGVNKECRLTSDLFKNRPFQLKALFCPEHGLKGVGYAFEKIEDSKEASGIPVYSLHGKTRRPTDEMLKDIHVLIYDIQDIGVRAYTYATTLFYVMEEAAKKKY